MGGLLTSIAGQLPWIGGGGTRLSGGGGGKYF